MSAAPTEIQDPPATPPAAPTPPSSTPPPPPPPAPEAPKRTFYAPPTPPAPTPPAAPAPPTPPMPGWAQGVSPEDAAWLASKGLHEKTPADVVKLYRNLETFKGVPSEQIMRKPNFESPESLADYRKAVGVPDTPEGYGKLEIGIPTGILEQESLAKMAHELDLAPAQFKGLMEKTGTLLTEIFQAEQERLATEQAVSNLALDKEWGPMKAENEQLVDRAVATFLTEDEYNALKESPIGEAGLKRALARLGARMGEHKPVRDGLTDTVPRTPDWAKSEMKRLTADSGFKQRMADGDATARAQWATLLDVAHGKT